MISSKQEIKPNLLSIVIITRNEAENVARCIESATAVATFFVNTDIMLVDSASSDGTVDIASNYPISIVQLRPHWPLTPSAGRYLGTLYTKGQYILFIDGDCEVYTGWVTLALEFLQGHSEVAGADGIVEAVISDENEGPPGKTKQRIKASMAAEVKSLGGNSLYRRKALEKVGTFNPYLVSFEEAELALRLRHAGYKLWRFPTPIARHFSESQTTLQAHIQRFRIGFYPKSGWTLRATLRSGLAWKFIREFLLNYLMIACYLILGLALMIVALAGDFIWLLGWLLISALAFMAYSFYRHGPGEAFNALIGRLMLVYGLIIGFITAKKDYSPYPVDVVIVQRQPGCNKTLLADIAT
jgi:glycosyltransferase involved in cell wall biosynthesis